ncbi:MAG TPA: hypothetical protein VKZ53_17025 [Candidatus Angelobacter sp.]|nr:hypothetical protein [Candidatus Angelobacter sp.]
MAVISMTLSAVKHDSEMLAKPTVALSAPSSFSRQFTENMGEFTFAALFVVNGLRVETKRLRFHIACEV